MTSETFPRPSLELLIVVVVIGWRKTKPDTAPNNLTLPAQFKLVDYR